jgi:hypothetical protein
MTEKKTKRNLAKPYGYKPVEEVTQEERDALKHALWSEYTLEEHYNYAKSPIISFYHLGQMDRLFAYQFSEGKDIAFITSIADWTQHTFRSTKNLDMIVKKHETYHSSRQQGFFNLNNAIIVFENFFKYLELPENEKSKNPEAENRYEEDIKHHYLSDLCKISIHLYCYNKKINNIEGQEVSLNWVKRFFKETKDFQSDKGNDNYYWSRHSLDLLSEVLKVSKNISERHEIVQLLMPDIEKYMPKLWSEMDYVVKHKLFKPIGLGTESFQIVEDLLNRTVGEESVFLSIKKEMNSQEMESKDKVIYFLTKYWHKLTPEECEKIPGIFMKDIKTYSNPLYALEPMMHVITPLEKIIKLFDSRFFADDVKATDIYKQCYEILDARTLRSKLEKKLPEKPGKDKLQKI